MAVKRRVAVLFGGRAPEHDVSIVSGLQALGAIDTGAYEAFPVYLSMQGEWFVGDALRDRANYIPNDEIRRGLTQVTLNRVGGAAFDAIHRADDFLNAVAHRAGELAVEQ